MPKKILVVDDSPFIRVVLRDIVEKALPGAAVVEAGSGTEAFSQFKKELPDLVLLDIIMPEGENEGINVLRRILDAAPQAKVIMVTAVGHDVMIERCKKLGALDYTVKPFDDEEITELLKKHIGAGGVLRKQNNSVVRRA